MNENSAGAFSVREVIGLSVGLFVVLTFGFLSVRPQVTAACDIPPNYAEKMDPGTRTDVADPLMIVKLKMRSTELAKQKKPPACGVSTPPGKPMCQDMTCGCTPNPGLPQCEKGPAKDPSGGKAGEEQPKKEDEKGKGDEKGKEGMPEVPKPPGGGEKKGGEPKSGGEPKNQEKSDIDSCKLGIGVGCEPKTAETPKAATPSASQEITKAAAAPTPTPTTDTTPVASKQVWQPSSENKQYDLNPLTELRTTVSSQGSVGEPRAFGGGDTFGGTSYGGAQSGGGFGGAVSAVASGFGSVLSGIQGTLTNLLGSLPRFFGR